MLIDVLSMLLECLRSAAPSCLREAIVTTIVKAMVVMGPELAPTTLFAVANDFHLMQGGSSKRGAMTAMEDLAANCQVDMRSGQWKKLKNRIKVLSKTV